MVIIAAGRQLLQHEMAQAARFDDGRDGRMDPSVARWIVEHADTLLRDATLPVDRLSMVEHLRKRCGANECRHLCDLIDLRTRGRVKFSLAQEMFFTRVGYEQSSSEAIARYKAQRFPKDCEIVDLCCGIGGDAIGLGQGRFVTLVDRCPASLEFALANTRVYGVQHANGIVADIRSLELSPFDYWHADPDRRAGKQRRSSPEACEPPLSELIALPGGSRNGAVKLSPAADPVELLAADAELEWVGHHRECSQLVAWFGDLARHPGKRTATNVSSALPAEAVFTFVGDGTTGIPLWSGTPRFVHEPSPTVLAAGLESSLARQHGLGRLVAGVAYLASDQAIDSAFLSSFETVEQVPYRKKTVEAAIRRHGLRVTEVKKRGVRLDPMEVSRQLPSENDGEPAVLILFPSMKSVQAILARRSP